MAYTIIQAPGGFSVPVAFYSMHSPLWHVVTSSNSSASDFRFVMDIHVAGSVLPTARMKVSPDANGQGKIDVSRVVRTALENYYAPRLSAGFSPFTISTNDITVSYQVYYGEEYGGIFYSGLTADTYYVYNSYSGDTPGGTASEPGSGWGHEWNSNRDLDSVFIPRHGRAFISYLNDPEENLKVRIQEVDEDGIPINPLLFYTSDLLMALDKLLVVNLNLEYINAMPFTGFSAPIPTTAAGYRIAIIRGDGVTISPWVTVRWMCEAKVPATTIHFLNRFGGFDSYHFSGPTRKAVDIDRNTYERIGAVSSGGLIREWDNSNLVYADTVIPHHTKQTWSRKLSSGFVDDAMHEWLWQLLTSPQVYFEDNGYSYPVLIKTQQWTEKKSKFDKLYNLDIEIEMGRRVTSQNR